MSGSAKCPHPEFHLHFNMMNFPDTNIRYLEISGFCKTCLDKLTWRGLPMGLNPDFPTMNVAGETAHLPLMIGEEIYDGKSIGFGIDLGKGDG